MRTIKELLIPRPSKLLDGIPDGEAECLLRSLGATTVAYEKGEPIAKQWSKATHHYLVASGEVHTYYSHESGRRSVTGVFRHGDSFGIIFAFSEMRLNPSSAVAVRDTVAVRIPIVEIITNGILVKSACGIKYIQNFVDLIAQSAFNARLRAFVLEQPTIEERVLAYLKEKAKHAHSSTFDIPLDRQELSDFLACDRSSLSSVLAKMRGKRIIDFSKNHFELKA